MNNLNIIKQRLQEINRSKEESRPVKYAELAATIAMVANLNAPFKQSELSKSIRIASQNTNLVAPKSKGEFKNVTPRRGIATGLIKRTEKFADTISQGNGEFLMQNNSVLALVRGLARSVNKIQAKVTGRPELVEKKETESRSEVKSDNNANQEILEKLNAIINTANQDRQTLQRVLLEQRRMAKRFKYKKGILETPEPRQAEPAYDFSGLEKKVSSTMDMVESLKSKQQGSGIIAMAKKAAKVASTGVRAIRTAAVGGTAALAIGSRAAAPVAAGALASFMLGSQGDSQTYRNSADGNFDASSISGLSGEANIAAKFIADEEKYASKAYKDATRYSVGYGHQITDEELKQGYIQVGAKQVRVSGPMGKDTTISKADAQTLLAQDIEKRYMPAARSVMGEAWSKMNDRQKAAVISYTYNAGAGGLQKLVKKGLKDAILKGDSAAAADIIKNGEVYSKQNGVLTRMAGLEKRRSSESALFNSVDDPKRNSASAMNQSKNLQQATKAPELNTKASPTTIVSPVVNQSDNIPQGQIRRALPSTRNQPSVLGQVLKQESMRSI